MRERPQRGRSLTGQRYDVRTGPVAHGGHVVARLDADVPEVGGTVVFVRHALPEETVTVEITEGSVGDRFLRGDAVAVAAPSPDRVLPPCPYAGPGLCGGCDFQHVTMERQRLLKADVVSEQLRRLARVERAIDVEPLRADEDGTGWRTRMRYQPLPGGMLGLRAHRSHRVVPIAACLVQAPEALVTVEGRPAPPAATVTEQVGPHSFEVSVDGFWQGHRDAPAVLSSAVLEAAELSSGERVLDLYCGVGLFTAPIAEAVGRAGRAVGVEGDVTAAELAEHNLASYAWAEVVAGPVDGYLRAEAEVGATYDVVVLDPPREGAKRKVVEAIVALSPRTVVYVACDPAAFARDLALFMERGYELAGLRAFDAFPMTHHVELVAQLQVS